MIRHGVQVAGLIDFDVLDAVDEALAISDGVHYPLTAGIESRIYVEDFAKDVLNSPNEPGIAYYCGVGFVAQPRPGSEAARTLQWLSRCARERNVAMLNRLNNYLQDVQLDYEKDVLPLSAAGNATERHMLEAFEKKAESVIPDRARRVRFWAAKMQTATDEMDGLMRDSVQFRNAMRKKLMKFGGPGYVTPDPKTFPPLAKFVDMIRECGAMPMYAWLDGTNSGEADAELLVDYFLNAGGVGLNIIPDRNWNLKDPAEKSVKVDKLNELMAIANRRRLPVIVGTEINSSSQPLVDHFDAPELKPYVEDFLKGAHITWGHSLLLRHGGFGYISAQSEAAFGRDVAKKNAFFQEVGACPVPHGAALQDLRAAAKSADPKGVLRALKK